MPEDGLPAVPGTPHPLESFASESVRDALSCALSSRAAEVLEAWRWETSRADGALAAPPEDVLLTAFEAILELFRVGTLHRMNALLEHVISNGGSTLTSTAEAARLHRMLSRFPMAAMATVRDGFRDQRERLDEAIALLLTAAQMGASCLYHILERTLFTEVQEAQERQLRFFQEITRLATNGRLRLVEPHEVPTPEGGPIPIRELQDGSRFRQAAVAVAGRTSMEPVRRDDLALAVGEAVSNVLKHAGSGVGHAWSRDDSVYVFIADTGRGITMENLPKALTPGWSSEPSLGMGFTLMLEMSDAIWLSTGPYGTTVCIEKSVNPRTDPLLETLMKDDRY